MRITSTHTRTSAPPALALSPKFGHTHTRARAHTHRHTHTQTVHHTHTTWDSANESCEGSQPGLRRPSTRFHGGAQNTFQALAPSRDGSPLRKLKGHVHCIAMTSTDALHFVRSGVGVKNPLATCILGPHNCAPPLVRRSPAITALSQSIQGTLQRWRNRHTSPWLFRAHSAVGSCSALPEWIALTPQPLLDPADLALSAVRVDNANDVIAQLGNAPRFDSTQSPYHSGQQRFDSQRHHLYSLIASFITNFPSLVVSPMPWSSWASAGGPGISSLSSFAELHHHGRPFWGK
jgi:hypothetical protein